MTRRGAIIFVGYVAITAVVMSVAVPFRMIADSVAAGIVVAMLVGAGAWVRVQAYRTESFRVRDMIAARGIYSVIRYPKYLANALIVFGLTVATGVVWYMIAIVPVVWIVTSLAVLDRDQRIKERYEEEFYKWRSYTSAVIPKSKRYIKSTIPVSAKWIAGSQGVFWVGIAVAICSINAAKNIRIGFEFALDWECIVMLAVVVAVAIWGRVPSGTRG